MRTAIRQGPWSYPVLLNRMYLGLALALAGEIDWEGNKVGLERAMELLKYLHNRAVILLVFENGKCRWIWNRSRLDDYWYELIHTDTPKIFDEADVA